MNNIIQEINRARREFMRRDRHPIPSHVYLSTDNGFRLLSSAYENAKYNDPERSRVKRILAERDVPCMTEMLQNKRIFGMTISIMGNSGILLEDRWSES